MGLHIRDALNGIRRKSPQHKLKLRGSAFSQTPFYGSIGPFGSIGGNSSLDTNNCRTPLVIRKIVGLCPLNSAHLFVLYISIARLRTWVSVPRITDALF